MTFPERLHEVIQDPDKEAKVLDMIRSEVLKEYAKWREPDVKISDSSIISIGAMGASSNLLCVFAGVTT